MRVTFQSGDVDRFVSDAALIADEDPSQRYGEGVVVFFWDWIARLGVCVCGGVG